MAMKILATSDLHLGKRSSEVPLTEKESSTRYTWEHIVDGCLSHTVDVLLLAGDIVDRDNRFFEAVGPLQAGLEKLDRAGITVIITAGNHDHDVLPAITGKNRFENVHILGHNGEWEVKTITRNNQSIQFVGWSFPRQFVPESPLVNFSADSLNPNFPAIGIFHGDAFSREKKYGPFDVNNLLNKGVDAWIIGHIHKPTILHDQNPFICYPGSPHALSPKETGLHSPLMLTVSGKHKMEIKPVVFSPVRYETISINITEAKDEDSFRDIITSSLRDHARSITTELEKVRFLIYDIKLEGRHPDVNVLSRWAGNVPDYRPDVESATIVLPRKVINNAEPSVENLHELASQPSPAGIVAGTILALREGRTTGLLESLRERWYSEREKLVNAVTYQPLSLNDAGNGMAHEEADRYILRECNRLLNEFIKQQAN